MALSEYQQKSKQRAESLIASVRPFKAATNGVRFEITGMMVNEFGGLVVGLTGSAEGRPIPKEALPFVYYNIGPLVRDPNGTEERSITKRDGTKMSVKYSNDWRAALTQRIIETIRHHLPKPPAQTVTK